MKCLKFLCVLACMACATIVNAQVSLGLQGGYVNAKMDASSGSFEVTQPGSKPLHSWQAGFYLNIPVFPNGALQPGLSYIVKGANRPFNGQEGVNVALPGATKIRLQYLELPVNLVYKIPIGIGKLAVGGGGYAAYATRGDYTLAIYKEGKLLQSSSQQVDFSKNPNVLTTDYNLHRWDAGLNATATIEFNCYLTLGVKYSYGLVDIDRSGGSLKNRYFGVNLGVLFNREDW
ncbi:PorT family protein [Chitinophaga sp. G-6-1-13]|uniref:PorT family protein n=1 Tax=Chitinophaga fulva TaxID=2728842 RepID=A0A848GE58_9BACT|nr:porin family protein [Chitinophaga fulva]NML36057.1 PorT family protein [Chitinophaga fulva]